MIGSSVVEVEVDGETKYKVVFKLEATEETVQAAQQEEEITRMNNSLDLPVSSTQTTTTRIESIRQLELRRSWQLEPKRNFVLSPRPSRRDEGYVLSRYSGRPNHYRHFHK